MQRNAGIFDIPNLLFIDLINLKILQRLFQNIQIAFDFFGKNLVENSLRTSILSNGSFFFNFWFCLGMKIFCFFDIKKRIRIKFFARGFFNYFWSFNFVLLETAWFCSRCDEKNPYLALHLLIDSCAPNNFRVGIESVRNSDHNAARFADRHVFIAGDINQCTSCARDIHI